MKTTDRTAVEGVTVANVTLEHTSELLGMVHTRITPHHGQLEVGGNEAYYLHYGGGAGLVEVVDTICLIDDFGRLGRVAGYNIVSRSEGERRMAADAHHFQPGDTQKESAIDRLRRVGGLIVDQLGLDPAMFIQDDGIDLVALDLCRLERIVASDATVRTFAEGWRQLDAEFGDAGRALLRLMAQRGELVWWYDGDLHRSVRIKEADQVGLLSEVGVYYESNNRPHGVRPPVVAMFAMAALRAALKGQHEACEILYVSSDKYTRVPGFKQAVAELTARTLAELGQPAKVSYLLLSGDFAEWDKIGSMANLDDIVQRGERLDAATLIRMWEGAQR